MEEYPWPKKGNKLFIAGKGHYDNAHFGWGNVNTTYAGYCLGYKESADALIDFVYNSKNIRNSDTFIFPVLFLYRQYLELELKWIYIKFFDTDIEKKRKKIKECGHNLLKIWNKIEPILRETASPGDFDTINIVKDYIKQFNSVDESSTTFRYPIDKDLNGVLEDEKRISYSNLQYRMDELHAFFTGVKSQLEEYRSYKIEMEEFFG